MHTLLTLGKTGSKGGIPLLQHALTITCDCKSSHLGHADLVTKETRRWTCVRSGKSEKINKNKVQPKDKTSSAKYARVRKPHAKALLFMLNVIKVVVGLNGSFQFLESYYIYLLFKTENDLAVSMRCVCVRESEK